LINEVALYNIFYRTAEGFGWDDEGVLTSWVNMQSRNPYTAGIVEAAAAFYYR
jgi:hypothetical protein